MNQHNIWQKKHRDYSQKGFIHQPTIFSQQCLGFFPSQGSLLDLGCGQGQDSIFFSQKSYQVTGIDFSEYAIKQARTESMKLVIEPKFLVASLDQKLPLNDSSFDIIYSHLSLHFFRDFQTKSIFNEIHRVAKPNAIFASLFNTIKDPEVSLSEKIEPGFYKTPSGLYKMFFTPEYLHRLTKDGFDIILLDEEGSTYKDEHSNLIRLICQIKK